HSRARYEIEPRQAVLLLLVRRAEVAQPAAAAAGHHAECARARRRLLPVARRQRAPHRRSRSADGPPVRGQRNPPGAYQPQRSALLGVFPLPNALDRSLTKGAYNYNFQESLDVPKRQNVVRLDYHPSARDAFYGRISTWYGDN